MSFLMNFMCVTIIILIVCLGEVRVEKMLPIADFDPNESEGHVLTKFELEPDRDTILDQLLPQYAESLIYGAIVDAKTAEHAAGMTAMQTATDNAKKIINDLTIQYNRARQSSHYSGNH